MLIDWLTCRLERSDCPDWPGWSVVDGLGDRVVRYCAASGELRWETSAWDSVRSDSHQLSYRAHGDALWMQGSPARAQGDGDTVFGPGGLDIVNAFSAMGQLLCRVLCLPDLPHYSIWRVSRIDVTGTYALDSLEIVRQALTTLRGAEGGRYRVSQQAGDTVYWSHRSRLRSGKAYAKGPHLRYLSGKPTYTGRTYTAQEHDFADRLLRLELTLGAQWIRERCSCPWFDLSAADLHTEWENYFGRLLGEGVDVTKQNIHQKIINAAPTVRQGDSAARTWALIQTTGWQSVRDGMSRNTWYRHLRILRSAGLSDTDISSGVVVDFRRVIVFNQVDSWPELVRHCAA